MQVSFYFALKGTELSNPVKFFPIQYGVCFTEERILSRNIFFDFKRLIQNNRGTVSQIGKPIVVSIYLEKEGSIHYLLTKDLHEIIQASSLSPDFYGQLLKCLRSTNEYFYT